MVVTHCLNTPAPSSTGWRTPSAHIHTYNIKCVHIYCRSVVHHTFRVQIHVPAGSQAQCCKPIHQFAYTVSTPLGIPSVAGDTISQYNERVSHLYRQYQPITPWKCLCRKHMHRANHFCYYYTEVSKHLDWYCVWLYFVFVIISVWN